MFGLISSNLLCSRVSKHLCFKSISLSEECGLLSALFQFSHFCLLYLHCCVQQQQHLEEEDASFADLFFRLHGEASHCLWARIWTNSCCIFVPSLFLCPAAGKMNWPYKDRVSVRCLEILFLGDRGYGKVVLSWMAEGPYGEQTDLYQRGFIWKTSFTKKQCWKDALGGRFCLASFTKRPLMTTKHTTRVRTPWTFRSVGSLRWLEHKCCLYWWF